MSSVSSSSSICCNISDVLGEVRLVGGEAEVLRTYSRASFTKESFTKLIVFGDTYGGFSTDVYIFPTFPSSSSSDCSFRISSRRMLPTSTFVAILP